MKLRKIEGILLTIGFGAVLLGIVLFMVTPLLVGSGFEYSGIQAFLAGCKSLFVFDFTNTIYTLLFVITIVTVLVGIFWAVIVGVKKHPRHYVALVLDVVFVIVLEIILMTYFVAPVTFNGAESANLFSSIMALEGNLLGKLLSMLTLGFFYLALMFLTLYGFIDIATLVLGTKVHEGFVETIKDQIIQALPVNPLEGYDDRKAREEAFFKACIETGEFTQYDEIDLGKPLEGYTEEPVFETTEIEEETAIVTRHNYVKVTKKQSIEVK